MRSRGSQRERLDRGCLGGNGSSALKRALSVRFVLAALGLCLACGTDRPSPLADGSAAPGSGGRASAAGGAAGAGGAGGTESGAAGAALAGAAGMGGVGGANENALPGCVAREGCQLLCSAWGSDPAGCGLGDAAQCRCICEERFNGPCPDELDALVECVGDSPAVDCSVRGRVFEGCEAASIELQVCDFLAREQLCAQSFPLCMPYCQAATLSFCPQGPESVTSCLCGCEASLATRCASELEQFMTCSSGAPEFSCGAAGRPVPTSCDLDWQALEACLGGDGSAAPDAG